MLFRIGKPVTGNLFYDRTASLGEVADFIEDGQDLIIKAPRRYGKTSLVKEVFRRNQKPMIYVDIRALPRLELLAEQIIDESFAQAGVNGFFKRLRENVITLLKEGKHNLKMKTEVFEYSVEFLSAQRNPCELLAHAFDIADKIAEELPLGLAIVIDEFQDIKRFECGDDILEYLRSIMQHKEHTTYVFLGSIVKLMTEIFEDKKSPFYQFCRKYDLKPFDGSEVIGNIVAAFRSRGIVFDDEADLSAVIERLGGHPANTMIVMQNIYNIARHLEIKSVSKEHIDQAYRSARDETLDLIEAYISEINTKKHYHDVIYRIVNGEKQVLGSSALGQVINGLEKMGYLYRKGRGEYALYDGFLFEYLKHRHSG